MSQNLARLNMTLTDDTGAPEQPEASASPGAGTPHSASPSPRPMHLLHPELADGLAPLELPPSARGIGAARPPWASSSASIAIPSHAPGSQYAPPRASPPSVSELLQRRGGAGSLQPILVSGSRGGVAATAECRLPPSPSDAAAATDLRRAALLRALQRRTSTPGAAPLAGEADVAMRALADEEAEPDLLPLADALPPAAHADEAMQVTTAAAPQDAAGAAQGGGHDEAFWGSTVGAALLPPHLRLGPHWQPRS